MRRSGFVNAGLTYFIFEAIKSFFPTSVLIFLPFVLYSKQFEVGSCTCQNFTKVHHFENKPKNHIQEGRPTSFFF